MGTVGKLAAIGIFGVGTIIGVVKYQDDTTLKYAIGIPVALATAWGVYRTLDSAPRNNSQDLTQRLQNTPQNQPPNSNPNNPSVNITYNDHSDRRSVHYHRHY